MKILIITTNGITTTFKSWPERLQARALAERRHQVRAITYLGNRDFNSIPSETIDNVPVRRLKRREWFSLRLIRELALGVRPDVVHIHHLSNQFAFLTAVICKIRRIPLVFTPHGLFHDPYLVVDRDRPFATPARYTDMILSLRQLVGALRKNFKPKRHLKNYLNHSPLLFADRVIPLSGHGRDVLLKLGIPSGKIRIVPNAIDRNWTDGEIIALPAAVQNLNAPFVLFMGQLKYRKGFDLLARAMRPVLERCPDAHFVFVSHSPIHEPELIRLAEEANARDRLIIVHDATEGEKAALFRHAAVYTLPTRYEGFGIPLIEAMSQGCPVVTTNIPVIDEMITDGANGLLFELDDVDGLADCLVRVLQDGKLRDRLVAGGYQTVERYYTPTVIAEIEAVYKEVVKK
jgi:glycogen synthase